MTAEYQLTNNEGHVYYRTGGYVVPPDPLNADQQHYQAWLATGNTPDPADPLPLVFSSSQSLHGQVRTTDATPTEVVRLTLSLQTGYTGQVNVIGVDSGNGALRVIRASFAIKRLNGGAVSVGAPVVVASHADASATSWTIASSVNGNDAIVTVTGAAGRTIDWLCEGSMISFTPAGT